MTGTPAPAFYSTLQGRFTGLLQWTDLTEFWEIVKAGAEGWYVYAIGEEIPQAPRSQAETLRFVTAVDRLLREDHREDYCGIVYTDSRTQPTLIKIFDPHHLGVSCGFSKNPPLPGWIMSRIPPLPLKDNRILPESRRRWWRAIWET